MRFLALRDGVHKLEKLRITGLDNEFDFVMRSVFHRRRLAMLTASSALFWMSSFVLDRKHDSGGGHPWVSVCIFTNICTWGIVSAPQAFYGVARPIHLG